MKTCEMCNEEINPNNKRFCSVNCYSKWKAENCAEKSPCWKGGRYINGGSGYVMVMVASQKYRSEHNLVMEGHIGRPLNKGEVVHHINGVKSDNRIENLQLMTISEHTKLHCDLAGCGPTVTIECENCGKKASKRHNQMEHSEYHFCSQKCHYEHRKSLPRGRTYQSVPVVITNTISGEKRTFPCQEEASRFLGRHKNYAGQVLRGRLKQPKGWELKYEGGE